jgi:hypothetical protein
MYTFLWQLYELTGDTAFVQVLYGANGRSLDGLPYDVFSNDPDAFRSAVKHVIARVGPEIKVGSVNKEQWHIAILRSGEGENERALWLQYDSMGGHGHANHMNLGLFAKGLDLLPDFGYKPVQFGGWGSPRANWYGKSPAHNTVVVDGADHGNGGGKTTLWANGREFRAIRASGPEPVGVQQFERTAALVDVSERDAYILDVFRVVGGKDHAKFTGSYFGKVTTQGLSLRPAPDYGYDTLMRKFMADAAPQPGWSVDWKLDDPRKYLPEGSDVHLRYTDLTTDAQASLAEAWIAMGISSEEDAWIPRIMVRRTSAKAPLASTFVSIIEPYERSSSISQIRRLPLETADHLPYPDANVALEVRLADNRQDLLISADVENPLRATPSIAASGALVQRDWDVRLDGEMCMVRKDGGGNVQHIVLCRGASLSVGDLQVRMKRDVDFIEIRFDGKTARVASGNHEDIQEILFEGARIECQ